MALQITLVKTPAKISVSKTSQTFYKQGGTIGRGEANLWVLPDPDKFLSSCHCEILLEGDNYYLLDLSTNGTFLNGSPEPLGKGTKSPLKEGSFFELGDYRFAAKVVADQHFAGGSPFASQPAVSNAASANAIFGGGSFADASSSFADPFASGGFMPSDFSAGVDSQSVDPLAVLDRARKAPAPDNFSGSPFDSIPGSFHSSSIPSNAYLGAATDHSPSIDQAINWPNASQESLIPEDWDDLLSPNPSPSVSPRGFDASPKIPPFTQDPFQQPLSSPTPVASPNSRVIPEFDDLHSPQRVQQPSPAIPTPAARPAVSVPSPAAVAPTIQAIAPEAAVVQHQKPAVSSAPNNRLISAMGLDAGRLSAEQIDEISDMVGELMRETVGGMMQILRSRASIKNEFRMNVTTIQPVENNPLKFSVGVDEALENMFIKKTNAYKKPVDAVREGFQEIGEHQVAMIAGIRHGFEKMMERFNPEHLEQNFNKQGKGGVIPGMQKAKYWNSYVDHYSGFVDNMESSFQHLFGGDFVNAYEDQLRKLSSARKKNK